MSGVYIKGMEMPGAGRYLIVYPDGRVVDTDIDGESQCIIPGSKAIPVPDHGRLIDADALDDILADQSKDAYNLTHAPRYWERALSVMRDYLEDAQTIIPAEESEG